MLGPPPPSSLRLVPLGGLGEVGMNCLVLEQGQDIVVLDCGIRFPHENLGIDVVRPDFSWLVERKDRVAGVFLTHGHEDHIGGLPYLLRDLDVPVWGPPHALGLSRRRLAEHGYASDAIDFRVAHPKNEYSVGSFTIEPIRVAHSIVEASALAVRTAAGTVLHTGDFNFDPDPPDGEPTDEARLRALGDEGVSLLLSDSTNVDVTAPGGAERNVGRSLDGLISRAAGRVFIALFASNIQRLLMIGDIAERAGRKICVLGRSLLSQMDIATDIGRLSWPSHLRVGPEEAKHMPRERLIVLAGGTQGESGSAMSRLATGGHPELEIERGDTVVLSSRIIPGNDVPVFDMLTHLLRRGAKVHTRITDPHVHTSGHATRAEQTRMIDLVRPRCFLPVHGTLHHLTRHAELAQGLGVNHVSVVENGTPILFDGQSLEKESKIPCKSISVGMGGADLTEEVLRERRDLARSGVVVVALALDRRGAVRGLPSVSSRGVPELSDAADRRGVALEVARTIDQMVRRKLPPEALRDEVRRAVRRHVVQRSGAKPVVDVHLLEDET